ncbi:hypothetical protein ONE63_009571 [Megalurothrips usitatus]|uniref:Uncharacterized protein n=1 Tax=Megalurothrips usitatus TaxID=439358 RepID=A0AAV7XP55_9NEOP|nr:hypothetical protein ONE63_009571 [Megalurothrips usitatus]
MQDRWRLLFALALCLLPRSRGCGNASTTNGTMPSVQDAMAVPSATVPSIPAMTALNLLRNVPALRNVLEGLSGLPENIPVLGGEGGTPALGSTSGLGDTPGLGGIPGLGNLPGLGDAPDLDLPELGDLPGLGGFPDLGNFPSFLSELSFMPVLVSILRLFLGPVFNVVSYVFRLPVSSPFE